ncbi:hypothetical protein GJAV_G00067890 [Gymnothorax javanicus]|nr:hypothetical protein GJAV_G00067890 [Gymnothorax javanicus]
MEKPVCLIENTSAGELQVSQEALDILSSIRQPVVVVSIVGLYRMGKSYLMNRLAGKNTGFSLGSIIQSETKGIWMWCVPHPCRDDQTLVLLDTEGLENVKNGDLQNYTWIFALALLLSSTVVYNSMRTIDHQALRSLHYITELTSHIKLKADGRSSSNSTEFLPSLIWTLRDFTPDLHFEESSITADEYLERSLNLLTENSSQMALCDNMRGSIETFFLTRKCFLLDQPAPQNEQEILDHLCHADLDPNLVQQVTDFCSYIFEHSKEKTIYGGALVTGRVLQNLVEKYVDAIRCGSFPSLEKVVQELTDLKYLAALEESVALFRRLLGERADLNPCTGGKDEDQLSAIHEACLQEALQTFKTNSFKDEEERYQRDLTERITEMYDGKCSENAEISRCHSVLQRLSGKLNLSSYMRPGGYADYKLQLDSISQAYRDALGEGVQAEKVLEAFRQDQEENLREIQMTDKVLSLQAGHLKEDEAKAECRRQQEEILAAQRAVERRLAVGVNSVHMNKPVCLIENTSAGELRVSQEALDILSSIRQPVVVVSIVGLYRTGKSYLMNRLAGKNTGFSLGSTVQSETKGIWMWCVPHPCRPDQTLVLLDTEGLGDVEKGDPKNDTWIFSLAVLLSSTLVYNSIGTINNEAVMSLHYVTELTEHVKVKTTREKESETSSDYVRFFPAFVWAVRDFTLDLTINGETTTADQYLENSLKLKSGGSRAVTLSNDARECIRNYFPERKCFVFDQPVSKDKLRLLDLLPDSEVDPQFVEQTSAFCCYIFNCSKEKTIKGGITVTGSLLGNLAVTYVNAIRSGKIPCLENAVAVLSQIENSKAVEESFALYRRLLGERVELHTETHEQLSSTHDGCLKEALQLFMKRTFKDEDQKYQKELMDRVKAAYDTKCAQNEEMSQNHCVALLIQLETEMDPDESYMKSGGHKRFKDGLIKLVEIYQRTLNKGVKTEEALNDYLLQKSQQETMILTADRNLSEQQRRLEEQSAQVERERQRAEAAKEQQRALERRVNDIERARRENERQLLEKMERDQEAQREEHQRVLDQRLREQRALLEQGYERKAEQLNREIQQLRGEISAQSNKRKGGFCVIS